MTGTAKNLPLRGRGTAAGGGGVNAPNTSPKGPDCLNPSTMLRMVPLPFREVLS